MSAQHTLLAALGCLLVSWTHVQGNILPVRDLPTSYDMVFDLLGGKNVVTRNAEHVTQVVGFSGFGCETQGVLKLALASAAVDPNRRRVKIDLYVSGAPRGWIFNLGDSITNDGYGGDAGTQSWDAEVQGVNDSMTGYYSDIGGSGEAFNFSDLYSYPKPVWDPLTLVAGDGHLIWRPSRRNLYTYFYSPSFFALNGQPDKTGPSNYDLYLGINRAIGSSLLSGTGGVCKVGIKFLPEC